MIGPKDAEGTSPLAYSHAVKVIPMELKRNLNSPMRPLCTTTALANADVLVLVAS